MTKQEIAKSFLEAIGEDVERAGLQATPARMERMWNELFKGYNQSQKPWITIFPNGEDGIEYDEMIVDTGRFYSHCEHHVLPFYGNYYFELHTLSYISRSTFLSFLSIL